MRRVVCALLVALLTAAAGRTPAPSAPLPIPPVPPANPPTDSFAPVPNLSVRQPPSGTAPGPQVQIRDFRSSNFNQDRGYTPGSEFQTSEDKRPIQTPGLSVQVPLQ